MKKIHVLLLLAATAAAPQTLDTGILGTITDPGGAVITAATVTITQPASRGATKSVI